MGARTQRPCHDGSCAIEYHGLPNGGTQKGYGSSPSSVLGHRAPRAAKGPNHGPPKGQTTGRQRAKPRTAKGSNHEAKDVKCLIPLYYAALPCSYNVYIVLNTNHNHHALHRYVYDDVYPMLRWHDIRGYSTLNRGIVLTTSPHHLPPTARWSLLKTVSRLVPSPRREEPDTGSNASRLPSQSAPPALVPPCSEP